MTNYFGILTLAANIFPKISSTKKSYLMDLQCAVAREQADADTKLLNLHHIVLATGGRTRIW